MDTPALAILLLNWNGVAETVICVESLLKNKATGFFDVYILDNGSKNNEYEQLVERFRTAPSVHIVPSAENLGFTGGNNKLITTALAAKSYEYVMLLNNDTEVPDDFVERLLGAVNHRVGIFGPPVRYFSEPDRLQSVGGRVNLWTGICGRIGDKILAKDFPAKDQEAACDYIFGCAFLIARPVIEKIGQLYDPYFIYYEEVDYCVSARRHNFPVWYVPTAPVYHKDSVSTKKISGFHIYTMWRNRMLFLRRQASALQFISALLYTVAYVPYFAVKYGWHEACALCAGTSDGLRGRTGNPMSYRHF